MSCLYGSLCPKNSRTRSFAQGLIVLESLGKVSKTWFCHAQLLQSCINSFRVKDLILIDSRPFGLKHPQNYKILDTQVFSGNGNVWFEGF